MDGVPAVVAAVSILAGGGTTFIIREWLWLRFCRYVHDGAVERGQNPKPEVIIEVAAEGRLGRRSPKQPELSAGRDSTNKSLAA